jgi:hypothetical protein
MFIAELVWFGLPKTLLPERGFCIGNGLLSKSNSTTKKSLENYQN